LIAGFGGYSFGAMDLVLLAMALQAIMTEFSLTP
jgi:hypothetical protein